MNAAMSEILFGEPEKVSTYFIRRIDSTRSLA
jgi:hypothetical protein